MVGCLDELGGGESELFKGASVVSYVYDVCKHWTELVLSFERRAFRVFVFRKLKTLEELVAVIYVKVT